MFAWSCLRRALRASDTPGGRPQGRPSFLSGYWPTGRTVGTILAAVAFSVTATSQAAAATLPADCVHERRLASGAIDPAGLCVSLGYGIRPTGQPAAPATRNVAAWAQNGEALPSDYYVRSDIAQQIAAGTARPRATYVLFFGGAFMCGNRADVATHARELARRGYVAIAAEYPLVATMAAYGRYRPNAGYNQGHLAITGANSCDGFASWVQTPLWQQDYLPKLRSIGLEPALAEAQRTGQLLIRALRRYPTLYGVDSRRIFTMGWSAGGSVALRLALGGDDDLLSGGRVDPGDSTVAGAISISGPACYPGSRQVTTPMLGGQIRPSESPACRFSASAADPTILMLQEPRGGVDDAFVPSALMVGGCQAINAVARGRCVYEDRPAQSGGYLSDGKHAYVAWPDFMRLLDTLTAQGVGAP